MLGDTSLDDLAKLLPESDKQIEELLALAQFPVDAMERTLAEQAEQAEKVLPHALTFVVSATQKEVIEKAIEAASDGTAGRDRKARGLTNLAKHYLANPTP